MISVTILTKNSELHIQKCLDALRVFEEVLILDNGSTDQTLTIAASYPNVKIHHHEFIGFGALRNLAVSLCKNDWILWVDSDEVLDASLIQSIQACSLERNTVYRILRKQYYNGKYINGAGWGNDYVLRLFNRNDTRINDKNVHEGLETKGMTIQDLSGFIHHYSYESAAQLIDKMNYYSTLFAEANQHKKGTSPLIAYFKKVFHFWNYYLIKKGFLYGYEGYLIAHVNAQGAFFKYMKLYEMNKKSR
jgi:glycosyltransferase involved in cell wall biosynthesis